MPKIYVWLHFQANMSTTFWANPAKKQTEKPKQLQILSGRGNEDENVQMKWICPLNATSPGCNLITVTMTQQFNPVYVLCGTPMEQHHMFCDT